MINRFQKTELEYLMANFAAVGVIGARQVGKTTLCKSLNYIAEKVLYLDLERPSDLLKLTDSEFFLTSNDDKTVILDEIHHKPELFPLLRSLIDEKRTPGRFLILGSASPQLLRQSSESLAGRIAYLRLYPLNLLEVEGSVNWQELWFKGGFPEPLFKTSENLTRLWYENFLINYVQKDLPAFGLGAEPNAIYRMLQITASSNASMLNYSMISKSMGVSMPTVKSYFGFLENSFLVFTLQPWFDNIKKRLIKSPKLYFEDTGVLHHLLRIKNFDSLLGNIAAGLSWENFVINQLRYLLLSTDQLYFYRTHDGAEIDLLVRRNNDWLFGAEIKLTNAPSLSKGTYLAIEDLGLKKLFVITPDSDNYLMHKNIEVIGLLDLLKRIATL
jgi:predicted AAA+ superfamily ATPase